MSVQEARRDDSLLVQHCRWSDTPRLIGEVPFSRLAGEVCGGCRSKSRARQNAQWLADLLEALPMTGPV